MSALPEARWLWLSGSRPYCDSYSADQMRAYATERVAAERERWRAAIAPEIPADMKDWHENSPDEWPEVAAAVLRSRREDAEMAWEMLAEWQARERPGNECKELMRWKSTHAPRLKALEGLWHAAQREANASREAVATLASERAANALLTDEVERLHGQMETLGRWIVEALKVLDTIDPDDLDESERLMTLIKGGEMLSMSALAPQMWARARKNAGETTCKPPPSPKTCKR